MNHFHNLNESYLIHLRRTLKFDVAQMKGKLSSKQSADLQEKRNSLYRQIQLWRGPQLAYMQMVASLLHKELLLTTAEPVTVALAEEVKLFLPSSVPMVLRNSMKNVAAKELRLCKAQADESLEDIRRGRRMLTGLTQFKKLNICGAGNKPNTRMQTLYNRLQRRIKRAANCYQAARNALYQLEPDGGTWKDRYRELDIKDIRGPGKQTDDPIQMTNGRFEQSWIWMVGHSKRTETNEEEFDNIMLAEWAKMRARRDRWEEEYKLVVEEMRRTVAYLKWKVMWWHGQAQRQTQLDLVTSQGLDAYAAHQAKMLELLAESCIQKWLPALSGANIVVDWGVLEMTVDSKTDENDEDGEWFNDEDEEENDDDPFDSYELDD